MNPPTGLADIAAASANKLLCFYSALKTPFYLILHQNLTSQAKATMLQTVFKTCLDNDLLL